MPTLTIITWRDIPAQVNAGTGRRAVKAMLPLRFQVAIDRAAKRAAKSEMGAYLAEWRRDERPCGDDLAAEVAAEVARLERLFTRERLAAAVEACGVDVGVADEGRRDGGVDETRDGDVGVYAAGNAAADDADVMADVPPMDAPA